jgi:glycosyltransferase involved in cell wall biosynthesis
MMEQTTLIAREPDHRLAVPCSNKSVEISVVVPVCQGGDDLGKLYSQYLKELSATGLSHEFIFVLKSEDYEALQTLRKLKTEYPRVRVILLHRWQGEATALSVGFEKAEGMVIITLPSYFQVEPSEVRRVLKKLLEDGPDVVIAWRHPRTDSLLNRALSWLFHQLIRKLTQTTYHDLTCGLRAMKRKVAEEVHLYGELHRFFPLLAHQRGFRVVELAVHQSRHHAQRRFYVPGMYLRRLLDILTVFFLFKFTKRPLRFFGLVGSQLFVAGAIVVGYLGLYRLLEFGGIAGRPLLILGALLMIVGTQFFSIGLLGELLIFTHSHAQDYQVHEILE